MFSTWKLGILKRKTKSLYTRITRNRLTFTFFLFGLFHCFAQGIMQSFLFTIDSEYSSFLSKIVHAADVPARNHTFLEGSSGNYRLRMCNYIPHFDSNCTDIFESHHSASNLSAEDSATRGSLLRTNIGKNTPPVLLRNETGITIEFQDGKELLLNTQCVKILVFPSQDLRDYAREDLALVFIQFWLFVISVIAMVYDSVPHIVAGFCARALLSSWSAYVLWRTHSKKSIYQELIGDAHTPCSVDLFNEDYFRVRNGYEIPDLILNLTALSIACFLSLTLFRDYNKRSFKCVGAPKRIATLYKYFMAVQACLQLELYVLMASMGLWIDQLFNTYIGAISEHTFVYEGVFIFYTVLVIPWLVLGWYAIRHERRLLMALFIFASFVFLFTTSIMFYSQVFRWTFVSWANLACFTVVSMILMGACMILGIICLRNFGEGLAHYLHADSTLESLNFAPAVFENDMDYHVDSKAEHDKAINYLEATFKLPTTREL
ncbi:uncharacterized protein EV420DRAFT_1157501 [Desarmillaria tabescens]|uniref:Uncharacterized protein n=1 Tax=Armillaria tabescens TaxID=1929756 RepID=A0AA39TLB5_ARMTA|nr:uncharacterized protein EV420DRAFT_1157501 [Desarmillaria tabescens]KAK0463122.1 hypothetical protein EV420DRAFT_1157501 [Desarmillaria tabescens]